jgi:hypothetical protein
LKAELSGGNSVYSCAGGIYALRKSFARSVRFPMNIWTDIGYLFFKCITSGYEFESAKRATVWFDLPGNWNEYMNQLARYEGEQTPLTEYFTNELLNQKYHIPKILLYKHKTKAFLKYPAHATVLFLVNAYTKYVKFPKRNESKAANAKWTMIVSTKQGIKV